MRNLALTLVLATFTICGCTDIEPKIYREVPSGLVDKEELVKILYDLQLIQAAYKGRPHNDTIAEQTRNARTIALLERHNLTQSVFESSMEYYHQSPDDMEEIYGEVITKLNMKITQLEEKID